MKLYSCKLNMCAVCPALIHDDGDGESPWTSKECNIIGKTIVNIFTIPDWCPLPDVESNEIEQKILP